MASTTSRHQQRTFYEILEVHPEAAQAEITKGECGHFMRSRRSLPATNAHHAYHAISLVLPAYRKRALKTHPDRGGNEVEFKAVAE